MGFLDRFHGTDKQFRESKQAKRHIRLFTLHSAQELVPEKQDKNKVKNK